MKTVSRLPTVFGIAFAALMAVSAPRAQMLRASAPSLLQHARVTVTSAQVLASNTSPITLVPAQGAGTVIVLVQAHATLLYGGTAYTGSAVPTIAFAGGSVVSTGVASFYTAAATSFMGLRGETTGPFTAGVNAPLTWFSQGGNPATGNSPVDVDVYYIVVPQ